MRTRVVAVVLSFVAITAVHLLAGHATRREHLVHVVFGAMYVIPAVVGSLWIGPRFGAVMAMASAGTLAVHGALAWSDRPMIVADALATAAMVLFIGAITAAFVALRERDRARHAQAERGLQREAIAQAIASLSRALRARDDGTAAHCERVAALAEAIAHRLGLAPDRLELVRAAGLLHDVGKLGVRDDVLLKRAALTAEERVRIERHPVFASELLAPIRGAEELATIVLAHHEAIDGTGYPRGLAGDDVPLEARIVRVADVYDALTAERPYKDALSREDALETMRHQETGFDPAALGALEDILAGQLNGDRRRPGAGRREREDAASRTSDEPG